LILGLFGEKVAKDMKISSIFLEHQVEKLHFVVGPQLRLLFGLD